MAVKVLFFGMLQDCTGTNVLDLDAGQWQTLGDVHSALQERFPCLRQRTYRLSCNAHFADEAQALQDGDELALLPPFSGG
jgi:molybdopterin converting factor small subunit